MPVSRAHLDPQDAYNVGSPRSGAAPAGVAGKTSGSDAEYTIPMMRRERSAERKSRSRSRRKQKPVFKKLLWVKQPYADNYTDEATFLDHLQRNPHIRPYQFWSLVADTTVLVQQVCAMVVFVCCFSGIVQDRVSPVTIAGWGTVGTLFGWVLWDYWVGQEEALKATVQVEISQAPDVDDDAAADNSQPVESKPLRAKSLDVHSPSSSSNQSAAPRSMDDTRQKSRYSYYPPFGVPESRFSPRNQQRLATLKSAVLIWAALLGLSPILKSLTKSTASDSIWAMAFWLMCMNVFFFDYGADVGGPSFPASLSTNAALMASTVLASRLPSTTHVFSLTLFSIQVFGLFPIFRRYLRHFSFEGHVALTAVLVMGAGAGTAISFNGNAWDARVAVSGALLSCLLTGFAMGLCSWWLIGLQQYKNEIHGPWDPARPIVRGTWD